MAPILSPQRIAELSALATRHRQQTGQKPPEKKKQSKRPPTSLSRRWKQLMADSKLLKQLAGLNPAKLAAALGPALAKAAPYAVPLAATAVVTAGAVGAVAIDSQRDVGRLEREQTQVEIRQDETERLVELAGLAELAAIRESLSPLLALVENENVMAALEGSPAIAERLANVEGRLLGVPNVGAELDALRTAVNDIQPGAVFNPAPILTRLGTLETSAISQAEVNNELAELRAQIEAIPIVEAFDPADILDQLVFFETQIAAIGTDSDGTRAAVQELSDQIAAIRPGDDVDIQPLLDRLDIIEGAVAGQDTLTAALNDLRADVEAIPAQTAPFDPAALQAQIAAVEVGLADIGAESGATADALRNLAGDVANIQPGETVDVVPLLSRLNILESAAAANSNLAADVDALQAAVAEQADIAAEVDALQAASADALALADQVAELMEQVENQPAAFDPGPLEARLDGIAADLADVETGDTGPLLLRLEAAEIELAAVVDAVADIPTGEPFDPSSIIADIAAIGSDIANIETQVADISITVDELATFDPAGINQMIADLEADLAAIGAFDPVAFQDQIDVLTADLEALESFDPAALLASIDQLETDLATTTAAAAAAEVSAAQALLDLAALQAEVDVNAADVAVAASEAADALQLADLTAQAVILIDSALGDLESVFFADLVQTWGAGFELPVNRQACDTGETEFDQPGGTQAARNTTFGTVETFCNQWTLTPPTLPAKCAPTNPAGSHIVFWTGDIFLAAIDGAETTGSRMQAGINTSNAAGFLFMNETSGQDLSQSYESLQFVPKDLTSWTSETARFQLNAILNWDAAPGTGMARLQSGGTIPVATISGDITCQP